MTKTLNQTALAVLITEQLKRRGSPWGAIEECREIYPGLYFVATQSHGGIYVDDLRFAMIPDYIAKASFLSRGRDKPSQWYEEDCDWALLALVFPGAFAAPMQEHARSTLTALADYRAALAAWDSRTT